MPIEGISMSTVFSLVTVSLALSLSAFLGASYLRPSFDIASIMSSVAYDIAVMYDIAYTLPGEVTINYYGPSACKWNYNQPSTSAAAFHCVSGEAVVINTVQVSKELLFVTNDLYMNYDYDNYPGPTALPPDAIYYPRPATGRISIDYYNAQICPFSDVSFQYCDLASADFGASCTDIDFITAETPYNVKVEDYSFVVSKKNVGNYYYTIDTIPSNPDNLVKFLSLTANIYTELCNNPLMLKDENNNIDYSIAYNDGAGSINTWTLDGSSDTPALGNDETFGNFVHLLQGYRWHVYDNNLLCQERLILDEDYADGATIEGLKLNDYVVDYCFEMDTLILRNPCDSVKSVEFAQNFITRVNNEYNYYASSSSCLKPYITYDVANQKMIIGALPANFNKFTGECSN